MTTAMRHILSVMGIDDHFVEHGSLPQLRKLEHLDMNTLFEIITSYLRPEKK